MDKVQEAEVIYGKIKSKLRGNEGKIVAIEVESGEYFIGNNTLDAFKKGRKKHPLAKFLFKRIGAKYTYVVGAQN